MDPHNADEDVFVDWLLRAYVGTRELHDVTPRHPGVEDPFATRYLVAVNDDVQAPRLLKKRDLMHHHLWVVPPALWEQAREGHLALPDGFGREPVHSWRRTSKHDDTTTCVQHLTLTNFRGFE